MLQGLQKVVSPEVGLVVCRFSFRIVNVCCSCVVAREDHPTLEKNRSYWFQRFGKSEMLNERGIEQSWVHQSHFVQGSLMSATANV